MTLQQLKYAIAVSDCKSINQAARKFYLTQPALSGAIRELEEEIGLTLFERTNRGVYVTAEGTDFLSYARQLAEQYELMEDRFVRKKPKDKFGVSTQHYTFAIKAFNELIQSYGMEKYEFSISETRTADVIEEVRNFKSEIGILFVDSFNEAVLQKLFKESNLVCEPLFRCHTYVYLSARHPLAQKEKIRFEELADYPCLSFDQGTNNSFYFAEEVLSTYEYDRMIKVNDRGTMLNLMVGLNGYTLCSGIICEDLNGNHYKAVPLADDEIMTISYIMRANTSLSPIGKKYLEHLKTYEKQVM